MSVDAKLAASEQMADLIAESQRRADRAEQQKLWGVEANARWHIVHVTSGTERATGDHLKRFKFPFYYPITRVLKRVPRKMLSAKQRKANSLVRRPYDTPLFKGYMFVKFELESGLWQEVFRMRGVRGMVYNNNAPAEVPDEMIENLRALEVDGAIPGETTLRETLGWELGDEVIVESGPFAGFPGVVNTLPSGISADMRIEELDESAPCEILVSIFGRPTPVHLGLGQFSRRQA